MTVTDANPTTSTLGPCISLDTGTLSPDQRVNYAYGMVLGLDEFLQEQLHTLFGGYLHDRALHGFGTVSGLAVDVAPIPNAHDFEVAVRTGIGVDQWGRTFAIRCDQCVRLGAWLAAQEHQTPGILGQHLGPSGEVTVFVVAAYAECLDRLVPLPGQPCSSSDKTMVASRIRDAWDLELRWAPPPMPRWDTDRRLARLLADVRIVGGLNPADSDEATIIDAVRALADVADDGPSDLDPDPGPSGTPWQLPAETAAEALDRIFTVWVTEVRGGLHPDLIDPEAASDPAVLLSTITFVPASPFQVDAPAITACDDPDDEGRPYLLHTQLIQELHWLSGTAAAPPAPPKPEQLATLAAHAGNDKILLIDAWFHLADPVRLPNTITVIDETGNHHPFTTSPVQPTAGGFAVEWQLRSPDAGIMATDGLQIGAVFPANTVLVKDALTTLAQLEHAGLTLLDAETTTGDVTAYTEVRVTATAPPTPNVEFVTVTDLRVNAELALIELWFHIEPRGVKNDAFAIKPAVKLFDDTTGNELKFVLTGPAPWSPNVWRAQINMPTPGKGISLYVRHQYLTKEFGVQTTGGDKLSLADWIAKNQLTYLGFEPNQGDIITFSRSVLPNENLQPFAAPANAPAKAAAPVKAAKAVPARAPAKAPTKASPPQTPAKTTKQTAGGQQ